MKKKFLVLTLCFTLIFSSINLKRSYADGGIISLPMLATVSALAVGTGIVINNIDDLYDLGKMFYDYVDRHNDLTWSTVQALFATGSALQSNKLVSVDSSFLDIVKGFFDNTFVSPGTVGFVGDVPYVNNPSDFSQYLDVTDCVNKKVYLGINAKYNGLQYPVYATYTSSSLKLLCDVNGSTRQLYSSYVSSPKKLGIGMMVDTLDTLYIYAINGYSFTQFSNLVSSSAISFPYSGGYTWDNVNDKLNENNELPLPIPGNLGNLVGQGSSDFWDNTDNLVGNGSLSIPTVSNPSISVDTTVDSFTGSTDTDVPGVGNPVLPSFPSWGSGLDFSPITQGVFVDKFPFCLAKDVGDIISVFDAQPKAPVFKIPFVSEELTIDLTEFELWFDIMRFFILIGFIISLIVLTRGIIG